MTSPPPLMSCKRHGNTTEAPPLPVVIVEGHTEGLPAIHMAIRRGWIRDSQLEVFHVDAHPDLAASKAIEPDDIFGDQLDLYMKLENDAYGISTWLLPPILQGHIGKVVWCRPTWAHQLPDGHHAGLRLGFRGGRMRVWTTLPYWAAEDEAVDPSSGTGPEDPSTSFDLLVSTAVGLQPEAADTTIPCWILDIDLDYFSCLNPVPDDCPTLPAHQSTEEEISKSIAEVERVLRSRYSGPPGLIIVARSEEDGFTPPAEDTSRHEAKLVFRPEEGFDEVTLEDLRLRPAYERSAHQNPRLEWLRENCFSLLSSFQETTGPDGFRKPAALPRAATGSISFFRSGFVNVCFGHQDSSTATGSTGKVHLYVGRISPSWTNIRDRMTYQYKVPLWLVPDTSPRVSALSIGLDHGYAASEVREDGHDYALPPPPPHWEEGNRGTTTE
ncbi:hypothetical protein FOL46_007391 [Perkinsus olseni]|uniref:Uncharacterized protein n=1 Tax=Perkinsus olseni TaxID=32597 RepID=A0A7J6MQW9_PEROL|nr:hypothetical protein FOL46_007391 [Perkinsus olseni]